MKILNFGSLNLDYVYAVDGFLRPGETKHSLQMDIFCGGKGLNQSIALARAGATVAHAGCIGQDGERLRLQLTENGVDTQQLRTLPCPTGHAIIQVDTSGQNCILLYGGANQQISDAQVEEVLASLEPGDIVLLQNEINQTHSIIEKAYALGLRVALNPSPVDEKLRDFPLDKVHWLLLNEVEGNDLTGFTQPQEILAALLARYPNLKIVLTLGQDGVLYRDKDTTAHHSIYPVSVVDTTAAGDTFTGYFLASVLRELPVEEALRLASVASSFSVSRNGASDSIPLLEEVEQCTLLPK